jgi:hypothetical protein
MGICINFNDDTVTAFSKVRLPNRTESLSPMVGVFLQNVPCACQLFSFFFV